MGRRDMRPVRIYHAATQSILKGHINRCPSWYNGVGLNPPSEMLVRTQPVRHQDNASSQQRRVKKPSKLFRPQKIIYEEDALRKEFFGDHPWELARPRVVVENDGRDAEKCDWSQLQQEWRALSGESVVQRQLWLLHQNSDEHGKPKMTRAEAYDQARKEFYQLRLLEDVQRRVAQEEAFATGAYFGKSFTDIGMELENQEFERWKSIAEKEAEWYEEQRFSMYTGQSLESDDDFTDTPEELNPKEVNPKEVNPEEET